MAGESGNAKRLKHAIPPYPPDPPLVPMHARPESDGVPVFLVFIALVCDLGLS